ncbi:MAG: hypothetical protein KAQ64_01485 [Candidatus Pacebacteria bacterium]|nr:hypothetical protein [Candidatus Paceibacterota bacterium]
MKKILVFASGSKSGGGSGFQKLIENSLTGILGAEIIAVVSNHENGGVRKIADRFGVEFCYFSGEYTKSLYNEIVIKYKPDLICLSGWLKRTEGLDPAKTINIHPGPLPKFGGRGMYGHFVHEKILEAYRQGEIAFSAVSMHFVTDEYDEGPLFFSFPVHIEPDYDADKIGAEVNRIEHGWQAFITNLVLEGKIRWDGKNPESLVVPDYVPRIRTTLSV